MKRIRSIIGIWLLSICTISYVGSQNSLLSDNVQTHLQKADSLIQVSVTNSNYLQAAQISRNVYQEILKDSKDYALKAVYIEKEIAFYEQEQVNDSLYFSALSSLGNVFYKAKMYAKSLETNIKLLERPNPWISEASVLFDIGKNYYRLGEFFQAEDFYHRSLNLYNQSKDIPEQINVNFALIRVYNKLRSEESLEKMHNALLRLETINSDSPFTISNQLLFNNTSCFAS